MRGRWSRGCRGNPVRILAVTPFEGSLPEGGCRYGLSVTKGSIWGWVEPEAGPSGSRILPRSGLRTFETLEQGPALGWGERAPAGGVEATRVPSGSAGCQGWARTPLESWEPRTMWRRASLRVLHGAQPPPRPSTLRLAYPPPTRRCPLCCRHSQTPPPPGEGTAGSRRCAEVGLRGPRRGCWRPRLADQPASQWTAS